MSKFEQMVKQDTPCLFLKYRLIEGQDQYEWGVVPPIPLLSLIGAIVKLQTLSLDDEMLYQCPISALFIVYDQESKEFTYFVHPDLPVEPTLGMLEVCKASIVSSLAARRMVAQQMILGPDGRTMVR